MHVFYSMYVTCLLEHGLILLNLWENIPCKLLKLKLHLYLPADTLQLSSEHSVHGSQSRGDTPVHHWCLFWFRHWNSSVLPGLLTEVEAGVVFRAKQFYCEVPALKC